MVLKSKLASELPGGLVGTECEWHLQSFSLGCILGICTSNMLPGDSDAANPETIL